MIRVSLRFGEVYYCPPKCLEAIFEILCGAVAVELLLEVIRGDSILIFDVALDVRAVAAVRAGVFWILLIY